MSGKNPWGDGVAFSIPTQVYDIEEWVADDYIDGPIGQNCMIVYPEKWTQCDNCYFDNGTQRSSNKYNGTGPQPFTQGLCPRCNGVGRFQVPSTDIVRMRVYWDAKAFIDIGVKIANPDGIAMCIGYLSDLPRVERANTIILQSDLQPEVSYECSRYGEAKPHGMRKNRYFIQYMRRTGSGG